MSKQTGVKDLAQLLQLYLHAKEIGIDFVRSSDTEEEYILMDDVEPENLGNKDALLLREFSKLGSVAQEFDRLFGSHQKVIASLEKYEETNQMKDLISIVERLQKELIQCKDEENNAGIRAQFPSSLIKTENEYGNGCAISTVSELEILNKVRTYINLNKDYHTFLLKTEVRNEEQGD